MTYYELFSSLETLAVNDAALAVKLGLDGWADPHGAMAKHCATSAFRMAKRLQGLREWMRHGTYAPGLDATIEYAEALTDAEIAKIAEGNAQRAYYATVQGVVAELKEQIADGQITDREGAREWLEQSIDGGQEVIYTHRAMEVCRISKNDGAYFADFGSEGAVDDSGIAWSKLAYCALLADVYEEVGDVDELFAEPDTEETE